MNDELKAAAERLRRMEAGQRYNGLLVEMEACRKGREEAEAECNRLIVDLGQAYCQLEYLWATNHSCPCGARPESLNAHPHVGGCPTAKAISIIGVDTNCETKGK